MSTLAANSGLRLLNKILDHFFRVKHIYRCFVNCSLITPPVVGCRIPLSCIGLCSGYVLVAFHVLCSERVGLNPTVGAK